MVGGDSMKESVRQGRRRFWPLGEAKGGQRQRKQQESPKKPQMGIFSRPRPFCVSLCSKTAVSHLFGRVLAVTVGAYGWSILPRLMIDDG